MIKNKEEELEPDGYRLIDLSLIFNHQWVLVIFKNVRTRR